MTQLTFSKHPLFIAASIVFLVALIGVGVAMMAIVFGEGEPPQVTTDRPDYYSYETVTITGTNLAPNTYYDVPVLRPDGSYVKNGGSSGWDWVLTDGSESFVYNYQLDGVQGVYWVAVYDWPWVPGSGQIPLATTYFMDADIHFSQCRNDDAPGGKNDGIVDPCAWTNGAINTVNSKYFEGDSVPQRLFHKMKDDGSNTIEFTYEFSKSDVYAYDFLTNADQTAGTNLNPCADLPGFVTTATCNALYSGTAPVPIPSDPFDSVSTRENPPGAGARNFRVACWPTACSAVSATIVGHQPSTTCFQTCGDSEVLIQLNFMTDDPNTIVGVWFGGHLAEAADPDGAGPIEGWGTGCNGSGACGSSSVSGAPFHIKHEGRDNPIQPAGLVLPVTFTVNKDFSDNNPASVTVSLSCASGRVSPASASASEATPASFTVTGFSGDPNCTATESPVPPGYTSSGTCSALLSAGSCTITNTLTAAPPPAVGGITELHVDGAEPSARPADSSNSAGALYAAVASAAATALALTAGAWYTRRRWLR